MDPIDALTVLGLYRSAEPLESATPAPNAWAERIAVPTFPGSWTPCSSTMRCTRDSSSANGYVEKTEDPDRPGRGL